MNKVTLLLALTVCLVVRETGSATIRPTLAQQEQQQETFPPFLFTTPPVIATTADDNATTAATSGDVAVCDLSQAAGCVQRGVDTVLVPLAYFALSGDVDTLVSEVCRSYPRYRRCVRRATGDACSGEQTLPFDMGIAAFDFLCSAQRKTVRAAWKCLSSDGLRNQIRECSNRIPLNTPRKDACQLESNFSSCMQNVFSQVCDVAGLTAIKSWLSTALQPFDRLFGCADDFSTGAPMASNTTLPQNLDTTTTANIVNSTRQPTTITEQSVTSTTPVVTTTRKVMTTTTTRQTTKTTRRPALIGCYDCNSGNPGGWLNPQCTAQGVIHTEYVTSTPCSTSCFARITKWPKGAVYRGCSSGFEWTFPAGFPTNGCYATANGDKWCFCNSHKCNTMDMTVHEV